jgi:DNA recombination protein RmuC
MRGYRMSVEARRPDMVVRLAGGKNIVFDAKVSLAAYLQAVECDDAEERAERLKAHARHLRAHVDSLAAKTYWAAFDPAPEFVVLFIPGEAFLAPALEQDAALLEEAARLGMGVEKPVRPVPWLPTISISSQKSPLLSSRYVVTSSGRNAQ